MKSPEESNEEYAFEVQDIPLTATTDATEENLASVQKFVAVGVSILMLCSMIYIGTLLFSGDQEKR